MKAKKLCTLSNGCGKNICCAYCPNSRCVERCTKDNDTCEYAKSKGNAVMKTKTPTISKENQVE